MAELIVLGFEQPQEADALLAELHTLEATKLIDRTSLNYDREDKLRAVVHKHGVDLEQSREAA